MNLLTLLRRVRGVKGASVNSHARTDSHRGGLKLRDWGGRMEELPRQLSRARIRASNRLYRPSGIPGM